MQSWKWRRMLKLMHTHLSIMVNRYSWNLRCERKLWQRKVTLHFTSLLKFTVERAKFWHIQKKDEYWENIEYWKQITFTNFPAPRCDAVCVVGTVKIEFSSELISQIRGVILYLADSEHDLSVSQSVFTIEEGPMWLKVPTSAFTFKTLLRHYAKRALTPRSLNVKLGPRRNYYKGRADIRH